jgi:hypothetical protein
LCYTAGITNLLGPKRSVVVGGFKSPNRLRWLAHREIALSELNLAMRFGGVILSAEFRTQVRLGSYLQNQYPHQAHHVHVTDRLLDRIEAEVGCERIVRPFVRLQQPVDLVDDLSELLLGHGSHPYKSIQVGFVDIVSEIVIRGTF